MIQHWWQDDSWADKKPMNYPDHRASARFERVALTTEPHLVPQKNGQLRLVLKNHHPHEALHLFVGR